ncbi:hypothetical protein, partial [Ralstonia pseudosolanacearum]|uniref:hypothetical protein n=1 Tax=Ralstonia pseudosolanacearum TaxID=1310165 RepID=UPI002002B504
MRAVKACQRLRLSLCPVARWFRVSRTRGLLRHSQRRPEPGLDYDATSRLDIDFFFFSIYKNLGPTPKSPFENSPPLWCKGGMWKKEDREREAKLARKTKRYPSDLTD